MLRLSDFDYNLPKELIAQYPLRERDASRLLVLNRKKASIEHRVFKDIIEYLGRDELLILNNTKVLPSRIIGNRVTGGKVEFLLLNRKDGLTFNALMKPARLKIGEKIMFNNDSIKAVINSKNEITFEAKDINAVYDLGVMPLPPYIKRMPTQEDMVRYQTVYAKKEGAVAAPTAGLHFTKRLLQRIKRQGTEIAYITLHIGYGTFKPVKTENIIEHKMESERVELPAKTIKALRYAKENKRKIFAVGTTSVRAIESYADLIMNRESRITDHVGLTNLFIYPGYKFKVVDCLLTNFHLPRTSLFILVCAFAGNALIKKAYQEAIDRKYRFYSYGDAMLII